MQVQSRKPLEDGGLGAAESASALIRALARPESYPFGPASVQARETHISWVFLAGDRAYKLKKPIVLSFLDYGTAARRHALCREEVRLNRRLAKSVYLGVRAVALDDDGSVRWLEEDDPEALDYLVEMRRYDESSTMAAMLSEGTLTERDVAKAAKVLARFHGAAQVIHSSGDQATIVDRRFELNVHQWLDWVHDGGEFGRVLKLERFAHGFVTVHRRLLESRARQGQIRAGHGDLRAEHFVLEDGEVQVVDCVEFDPSLREIDVADDLAFLVFDLTVRGGSEFVPVLLGVYTKAGGDIGSESLINFYACYRALVRSKVALIRSAQSDPASSPDDGSSEANQLLVLAESFAWRSRLPLVLVICGAPASGKTTLASALQHATGLPVVSSDVVRKSLLGLRPTDRASLDAYSDDVNHQTYLELGDRASSLVLERGGAIVDATCRHVDDRRALLSRIGNEAPVIFIECRAPRPELDRRARVRQASDSRVSDADPVVVARESTVWDSLDEIDPAQHLILRSDRRSTTMVDEIAAVLDERAGLPLTAVEL